MEKPECQGTIAKANQRLRWSLVNEANSELQRNPGIAPVPDLKCLNQLCERASLSIHMKRHYQIPLHKCDDGSYYIPSLTELS